eukprot:23829-Rhodomonas_salina.2
MHVCALRNGSAGNIRVHWSRSSDKELGAHPDSRLLLIPCKTLQSTNGNNAVLLGVAEHVAVGDE